nr:AAA family ATPase [Corynebacterium sp. TAE3-ERU12]
MSGLPCFGTDIELSDLTTVNYIFGPNGSGKTTISRSLEKYSPASNSNVFWEKQPETIRVYNRDYITNTFASASGEEPGVFLLGENSREIAERIGTLEKERDKIAERLERRQKSRSRYKEQLEASRSMLAEKVWKRRTDIPQTLRDRMPGIKASKQKCLQKVLEAAKAHPERGKDDFASLAAKATIAFDDSLTKSELIPSPPDLTWDEKALQTVLITPIVGGADSPLADLIDELSNSDWVRQGLEYFQHEQNPNGVCPFCQQEPPESLAENLATIFDDTYQKKRDVVNQFQTDLEEAQEALKTFESTNAERLESLCSSTEVTQAFHLLRVAMDDTQKSIQKKVLKPSEQIEATAIASFYTRLKDLVTVANERIESMNAIVLDRRQQQQKIINASWQEFARGHLNDLLESFQGESERLGKSIAGVEQSIADQQKRFDDVVSELRELTKKTTSSAKAVQDINDLLSLSQFHSFRLDSASANSEGYRIIRDNGRPADVETLSEGERTFITFLYFYHTLFAVQKEGETDHIVAVVDDPISSLDGDIMFVVSALMRRLIKQIRDDESRRLRQLIMLTHSTRFHNEVCYQHQDEVSPAIKFYRIRKFSPGFNRIEDCGLKNPIRTAYQELWDEVAVAESRPEESMPWLPNVLRRILETYFTTLGGKRNLYELGDELPIHERAVHDALIAWSHSGSHTIMDSEIYSQPVADNDRWLKAFARIFEKFAGGAHLGHYEMMIAQARTYLGQGPSEVSTVSP